MNNYLRFLSDLPYDILVSPYGFDFHTLPPAQARKSVEWFMEHLLKRMCYLRARCAGDLSIEESCLDYSAESLLLIWKWFLSSARLEKTPGEELEKMKKGSEIFGESYINKSQFTVATRYMLRDIGMYLGECFVRNYTSLEWSYYTKPKSDIYVNQPVIGGFQMTYQGRQGKLFFAPLHLAEVQAGKIFHQKHTSHDLFNIFDFWCQYVPDFEINHEMDSKQK